jgi:type IV secretory pathway TraG/TraD family ATPase VirD4
MTGERQSKEEKDRNDEVAAVIGLAIIVILTVTPFTLAWAVALGALLAIVARSIGAPWWAPLVVVLTGALILVAWGDGALEALTRSRRQFVHSIWQKDLAVGWARYGSRWLWVTFLWSIPLAGLVATLLSWRWGREDVRRRARRESRPRFIGLRATRLRRRLENKRRLPGDGVLIGLDDGGSPVRLTDAELAAHALIVGATGSGKTTTLLAIVRSAVRRRIPVVYVDLKGDPGVTQALEAEAAQVWCRYLEWSLDGPARWNPLAQGNATELKDKLIGLETWTEPHY